jgi:hypothetical protein
VGDTLFLGWDKSSDVLREFGVSGGFYLEEFTFGVVTKSFFHDSSGSVHHLLDLSVFFNNGLMSGISIVFFILHGFSSFNSVS